MKKNTKKLLSLMLGTAMVTSLVPMANVSATKNAIKAPKGETLLFSEDFNYVVPEGSTWESVVGAIYPRGKRPENGYNDGFISEWGGSKKSCADVDSDSYNNDANSMLMVNGASSNTNRSYEIYVPTAQRPVDGIVTFKCNIGFARSGSEKLARFDVYPFKDGKGYEQQGSSVMDINIVNTLKGNDITTSRKIDNWYDLKVEIDLDNDTYVTTITEHGTKNVVANKSGSYSKSNLGGFYFYNEKNGSKTDWVNCSPVIDNAIITHKYKDTADEQDFDFKQDFEGGASTSFVSKPSELPAPPLFAGRRGTEVRQDDSGSNNTKALYVSGELKNGVVQLSTGDVKTSGKYMLKYKFYPSQTKNQLILDSLQTGGDRARTDRGQWLSLPEEPFKSNRKWYDAELLVDLDNDTATLNVYEKGTTTVVATVTKAYTDALGVFEFSQDTTDNQSMANTARLDDVYFYTIYDDAPEFKAENFKLYAGGIAQADMTNVSPLTDSLKITFPQKMKTFTLDSDTIYVTDESGKVVPTLSDYDNGEECELVFDGMLTPGATYEVHITDLRNVSGLIMEDEYVHQFTVGFGGFATSLTNVTAGNETVAGIAAFTAGSELTVNYSAENATDTDEDVAVIVAYYKVRDNIPELVACDVYPATIDAYSVSDSLTQEFTVPDKAFDKVSVMLWNSTDAMQPLSDVIDFE